MKRTVIIFKLCIISLLFISCTQEQENLIDSNTEEIVQLSSIYGNSYFFFGYILDNVTGFERHELIKELNVISDINIKDGIILHYDPLHGISSKCYPSLSHETSSLLKDVISKGSSIKKINGINGKTHLFGTKNSAAWLGLFDDDTKKQIQEWTFSEFKSITHIDIKPIAIGNLLYVRYSNSSGNETSKLFLQDNDNLIEFERCIIGNVTCFSDEILIMDNATSKGTLYSNQGKIIAESISKCIFENKVFLMGFSENKLWIRMYEAGQENKFQNWKGEVQFDRNLIIDKGFGEIENFRVDLLSGEQTLVKKTKWGYVIVPEYIELNNITNKIAKIHKSDLLLLSESKIVLFSSQKRNSAFGEVFEWYDNTILYFYTDYASQAHKYTLLSLEGKIIENFTFNYGPSADALGYYSADGDILYLEPISLSDYILVTKWSWGSSISIRISRYRIGASGADYQWRNNIDSAFPDSRISAKLLSQEFDTLFFQIEVLNSDLSKKVVKFSIDKNTGKLQYLQD